MKTDNNRGVVKHTWWYQICKIHGNVEHGTACDGCFECAKDRQESLMRTAETKRIKKVKVG